MAFLRNRAVNLLNLHYAIFSLAMNAGGIFIAVFLLRQGLSVPVVLLAQAAIVLMRFVMRPSIILLGRTLGLRTLTIGGTIINALQYPVLATVSGVDRSLIIFCIVGSIGDTLYWTCYHAYFAALGDAEHRGHQIGAREALASVAAIVAPLAAGWALVSLGPRIAFGATAGVQLLSALPLFGTPEIAIPESAPRILRTAMRGVIIFAADGWIAAGYVFAWQIALFQSLGESFSSFGAAMALAGLAGALGGLLLGRHIDSGGGHRATWLALAALSSAIVFRALSTHAAGRAVLANASGALVGNIYAAATLTAVYNQAKRSPCALRFHTATEGGWDLGCASGCLLTATLYSFGVPLSAGVFLSLAGILPLILVLHGHYKGVS